MICVIANSFYGHVVRGVNEYQVLHENDAHYISGIVLFFVYRNSCKTFLRYFRYQVKRESLVVINHENFLYGSHDVFDHLFLQLERPVNDSHCVGVEVLVSLLLTKLRHLDELVPVIALTNLFSEKTVQQLQSKRKLKELDIIKNANAFKFIFGFEDVFKIDNALLFFQQLELILKSP